MKKYTKKELENKINDIKSYICSDYCKNLSDYKHHYQEIIKYQKILQKISTEK